MLEPGALSVPDAWIGASSVGAERGALEAHRV